MFNSKSRSSFDATISNASTMISAGTTITGDIECNGDIRIDGVLKGNLKGKAKIIIGTDSYASNGQLNILEEIKTIQQQTNHAIPLEELLQWATINGARALQLDDTVGSFENGKQPGIVLIESLNNLQTTRHSFARRII